MRGSLAIPGEGGRRVWFDADTLRQKLGVIALRERKTLLGGAAHPRGAGDGVAGNAATAQEAVGEMALRPGDAAFGIRLKQGEFGVHG